MTTRIDALDTPFAAIDLDIVERNLARAQGYFDKHKLALRPHINDSASSHSKTFSLPPSTPLRMGCPLVPMSPTSSSSERES